MKNVPSELFQKNLKRWSVMCPLGVNRVENLDCKQIDYCYASTGALNLFSEKNNTRYYYHSSIDPMAEAAQWFSKLKPAHRNVIYIFGVGLGYCYDAAKDWLKSDSANRIVFFENNPEVIHRLLESDRCNELLYDPQVVVYLYEHTEKGINELSSYCTNFCPFDFIVTSLAEENLKFLEFKALITFLTLMCRSEIMEYSQHGTLIFRNFFKNYLKLPDSYLADRLIGKFKNIPAIICGAGPSLNRNVDLLSTLQDKALIFAGGTAMNALNAHGIMPHFGVGIDPNPAQFSRLIANHAYETPFLYRSRMLYEALEIIHGNKVYVSGSGGYNITKWMENELEISEYHHEQELEEGHNVVNFSLALAHHMGCNPIITVGVDLAYSQGNSYATGIVSHPIHSRQTHFKTKNVEEELLCKLDIHGNPVYTLWKWIAESSWFTSYAKKHHEVTIINATEGGIGFFDIINLTLSYVRDNFLKKSLDLSAMVYSEIQNSPLPKQVTLKRIRELLQRIAENLRSCAKHIEKIIAISNRQDFDEANQLTNEIEQLEKEEAYGSMLKVFNDYYIKIHGADLLKLHLEEDLIPKNEYILKKKEFETKRYNSLRATAEYNASIIQSLLNENANAHPLIKTNKIPKNKPKKLKYPLPKPSKKEIYKFEHLDSTHAAITIFDTEMKLNYSEKFPLSNEAINRTYFDNGRLKSEQFYLDNDLHGPSTFYAPDGTLLSQTWFIKGKRQGKKWTYYTNGSIHSLERFYYGKEQGKQEYFYQNGNPKSLYSYKNGLLDGEVLLYHPEGQLARQLTFMLGKREGLERIWDEHGLLRIEAHYKTDKPIETARIWHSNGTLASETLYDKDSRRIETKQWDFTGKLQPREDDDFFDTATKGLTNLTGSLKDIVGTLSQIELKDKKEGQNQTQVEIEKLRLEMEKLNTIEKKIHAHMEFDEEDPKEALWKNPTTQHELEKQIEQMADPMANSLKQIQEEFQKLLNSLMHNPDDEQKK